VAAGLIDASGRLILPDAPGVPPGLAARLCQVGKERVFVLHFRGGDPAESLYLSQRDIRELQFAEVATLRIVSAGNVAGEGAKMALLSMRERAAAQALLEEVHYVELSDRADFNDRFVDRLTFPV